MTNDETTLFNLIVAALDSALNALIGDNFEYASRLLASVQLYASYAESILPQVFLELLQDKDQREKWPKDLVPKLIAILEAEARVPQVFKDLGGNRAQRAEVLDPTFNLAIEDRANIMNLCNSMRELVWKSTFFDQPHRRRLLDRIAAIEREVHQSKGKFDVILGGVSDVGETLGKFGKDVKPLVDRMKEIAGLARKSTKEYEQLPPPEEQRRLPPPRAEDDTAE